MHVRAQLLGSAFVPRPHQKRAHVVLARLARDASLAPRPRLEGHPRPLPKLELGVHARPELDDDPATLVAKAHGVVDHKVANGGVLQVVDVRAADTRLADLDKDLVRLGLGDGPLRGVSACMRMQWARPREDDESCPPHGSRPRPSGHLALALAAQAYTARPNTHVFNLHIVDAVQDKGRVVRPQPALRLRDSRHRPRCSQQRRRDSCRLAGKPRRSQSSTRQPGRSERHGEIGMRGTRCF